MKKYRLLEGIPPCFPRFQGFITIINLLSAKWIISNFDAAAALASQVKQRGYPSCNKTTYITIFFIFSSLYLLHRLVVSLVTNVQYMLKKNMGNHELATNASADADVVIVGMGTAGASLGIALARQGKRVLIIEK